MGQEQARSAARREILAAVNRARRAENAKRRTSFLLPVLYGRHLQQAVCIARRQRLVENRVLVAAGFNAGRGQ